MAYPSAAERAIDQPAKRRAESARLRLRDSLAARRRNRFDLPAAQHIQQNVERDEYAFEIRAEHYAMRTKPAAAVGAGSVTVNVPFVLVTSAPKSRTATALFARELL